ncbi:TetR/AcrR family transcriptional regulator [Thalassovita taeanensis]|uniref:Transcriptional regulator, TetR family n=1 Tax=Thalassovita taeanensis TaxID=657014 RepID=A0A1H9FJ56_9RHOB|nr:TetR/AcrR family transcriptional regulator [Thalassovita taeanensis]SEQ37991.1 transcriptional regulator, TetR family [Thalassovita taeanensis]
MQNKAYDPFVSDPKQAAILASAFTAFRLYGFRRTSMEDIARGAGMSRAAVYLHYRNKEDILRALTQDYYDQAATAISTVLARPLPATDALTAAFEAQAGPVFEAMLSSPHGQELLDTKYASSADIAREGEARMAALYADWLRKEQAADRISLTPFGDDPAALATTMMAALHGVKAAMPDYASYRTSVRRLAQLFGAALSR